MPVSCYLVVYFNRNAGDLWMTSSYSQSLILCKYLKELWTFSESYHRLLLVQQSRGQTDWGCAAWGKLQPVSGPHAEAEGGGILPESASKKNMTRMKQSGRIAPLRVGGGEREGGKKWAVHIPNCLRSPAGAVESQSYVVPTWACFLTPSWTLEKSDFWSFLIVGMALPHTNRDISTSRLWWILLPNSQQPTQR